MSEFIDVISPKALEQLKLANAEIVTMIANVKKVNENLIGSTTPSGSDSALKSLTAEYQKQEQAIVKVQKQLEKARLEEIKLQQAREKAFDKYEAQLTKEQAKLQASENLYNKVQAKLNTLSNEYKALATRKELGIALTDKEAQRYTFLQGKIQTYDKTLKAVDATMGKYQRNVGNYASGFSPLNNSINQLTREMPAFTYSVQTGFMALSNNIPIFTDAISQAITQNKELAKQGKPTTSVLSQLAGAFFGWGTALSVAITLTTVYGKEIGQFFSNLSKGSNIIKSAEESQSALNKAIKEGTKDGIKEATQLDILYRTATNLNLSYEQRLKAVSKMQEIYPSYFGNLTKEEILAGKAVKQYELLRDAIFDSARAKAIQGELEKRGAERLETELSLRQKIQDAQNEINRLQKTGDDLFIRGNAQEKTRDIRVSNTELIEAQRKALEKYTKDLVNFNKIAKKEDELLFKAQFEYYKKSEKLEADRIKLKDKETNSTKKNTEAKKEAEIYAIGTVKWINQQIKQIQDLNDSLSKNSEEYQVGVGAIKFYEAWLKRLTETAKKTEKEIDGISLNLSDIKPMTDEEGDELMEAGNRLREMLKNFKQGFIDEFGQESGFSKTLSILSGGLKKFEADSVATALAISEAFQEAFNTISQYSQANFEQQYANLEQQKKVAILFAGESTTAREEIERQYEEKRRAIQNRQAEAQKRLALFNIATDMAQAIVASFKTDPTGILAIAIGAIGAFQLGLVASQQIPQFYKGTDNAPEGWAWTQEKGAEIITDKSGRVKDTGSNGGAKLTYLSKGDKVFTAEQSKNIMFNKELNSILNNNGILPTNVINNKLDLLPLRSDIRSLENTIKNKSELHMISDRQGERVYQKEQGKRALLVSNRLRIK
jgi:hypothetical protein